METIIGEYEPLIGHSWLYKGPLMDQSAQKLVKMARNTTFGHILFIFTSLKLEMDALSGRTNLRRLLGGYEPQM